MVRKKKKKKTGDGVDVEKDRPGWGSESQEREG